MRRSAAALAPGPWPLALPTGAEPRSARPALASAAAPQRRPQTRPAAAGVSPGRRWPGSSTARRPGLGNTTRKSQTKDAGQPRGFRRGSARAAGGVMGCVRTSGAEHGESGPPSPGEEAPRVHGGRRADGASGRRLDVKSRPSLFSAASVLQCGAPPVLALVYSGGPHMPPKTNEDGRLYLRREVGFSTSF